MLTGLTTTKNFMSDTARIFMNGRSQAVRLPAAYRFKGSEVSIERRGGAVILREKIEALGDALRGFFAATAPLPEDFLKDRKDAPPRAPAIRDVVKRIVVNSRFGISGDAS